LQKKTKNLLLNNPKISHLGEKKNLNKKYKTNGKKWKKRNNENLKILK
jgi:hypothetical protein